MQRIKKIVPWTLLAFFVYAVVKSPTQAADLVQTIWDIFMAGINGIGGFFDALLNQQ